MHSRIVKALKKLGAKCCKEGTHVHGDNVDGLLECIAEHYAGGGSGGGLSIKSITFTDRPTAWEWLCNNHLKILKSFYTATTEGVTFSVNFTSAYFDGNRCCFTDGGLWHNGTNSVRAISPYIEITTETTEAVMGMVQAVLSDGSGIEVQSDDIQTIPDEYWAALSARLTVYYID